MSTKLFVVNAGYSISGFLEDYHAFPQATILANTPYELALRKRDGTTNLIVSEVSIFINSFTPAASTASGTKVELHWAATSGAVDSGATSTTRLGEFIFECQNTILLSLKESKSKLWIKSNTAGTYQIGVRYHYQSP